MSGKKGSGGPFIVWSPDGKTPPVVIHLSHKSATFAAATMAKKHPGQTFMVMAKAGRAHKQEQPA